MSAPISRSTSSRPVRVGLTPTPVRVSSASGCTVAATIQGAAAEMSPGMVTSSASRSPSEGVSVTAAPSCATFAPMAESMRSLWSRVCAGSTTVVGPSAPRAASSNADFTCAEATGVSTRAPCRRRPHTTSGGSVPPARALTSAPSAARGRTMRSIGRRRSEASPLSTHIIGNAASMPASSRIDVPELPQSSTSSGSTSAPRPRPQTVSESPAPSSMRTPSARRQWIVARVSSASSMRSMRASPRARALKISARCVIDLSPGTAIVPRSRGGLATVAVSDMVASRAG